MGALQEGSDQPRFNPRLELLTLSPSQRNELRSTLDRASIRVDSLEEMEFKQSGDRDPGSLYVKFQAKIDALKMCYDLTITVADLSQRHRFFTIDELPLQMVREGETFYPVDRRQHVLTFHALDLGKSYLFSYSDECGPVAALRMPPRPSLGDHAPQEESPETPRVHEASKILAAAQRERGETKILRFPKES